MADNLYGPYNFIRSRTAKTPQSGTAQTEEMAFEGRAPNFDNRGRLTGFRSRPGAPLSPLDTMHGLGIAGAIGTSEHDVAWKDWFRKSPTTTPSAFAHDPNDDSGINPHVDPIGASIAANSNWLTSNGLQVPPAPATNPMAFPNPAQDPSLQKSAFVSGNGVDPDYLSRVQSYNTNLYRPADTQQPPAAAVPQTNWNRTGWNTTTPSQVEAIGRQYSANN